MISEQPYSMVYKNYALSSSIKEIMELHIKIESCGDINVHNSITQSR